MKVTVPLEIEVEVENRKGMNEEEILRRVRRDKLPEVDAARARLKSYISNIIFFGQDRSLDD